VVGIVVVSHSARLAEGVVELARQMGGDAPLEAAGGAPETEDGIGTDYELVKGAVERAAAAAADGVLVLYDLGSAEMMAETVIEEIALSDGAPLVELVAAPLVEGAVAAAALASTGAGLDEVREAARGALPGADAAPTPPTDAAAGPAPATDGAPGEAVTVPVVNALGLHLRPAGRVVTTAGRFDATVTVSDATTGSGPVSARSLMALTQLGTRLGHEVTFRATGAQAGEALAALAALAAEGFGDEVVATAPAEEPAAEPPAAGARLAGVAAAPGIGIGPAHRLDRPLDAADDAPAGDPDEEWARLAAAREAARADVVAARAGLAERTGEAEAAILDAHALLLDDEAIVEPARRAITSDGASASAAWRAAADAAAGRYAALDDPYLRERAADVRDVGGRVLAHLAGSAGDAQAPAGIVIAYELTPGQAATLDPARVQGIATASGGPTGHAAILARALGLPAVVGVGPAVLAVPDGTRLVVDGGAGSVLVDPPQRDIDAEEERRAAADALRRRARAHAGEPVLASDGTRIEVFANLGGPGDAAEAVALGAEGVGLLRTEFLFLDRAEPPDEEEQLAAYRALGSALEGRPLVIRTLDVGADKPLPFVPTEPEANPFLGRRGIRLALARRELLDVQLRAILRAAAEHPVKVMFPMVATLAEWRAAKAALDAAREATGAPVIEAGIMVEVPAAALGADAFAREVDFLSVGTNDLAQYTMAAERGHPGLAALTAGPLPPLLRLIDEVCTAAAAHGPWVGVCGELASDPAAAALLAGLGVRELSMAPARVPEVKAALRGLDLAAARAAAERAIAAETAEEAAALAAPLLAGPA